MSNVQKRSINGSWFLYDLLIGPIFIFQMRYGGMFASPTSLDCVHSTLCFAVSLCKKKKLFVCIRRIHIHFIHYYCHFITNKRKTKDLYAVEHEAWKKTYVAITLLSFEGKYQKKFLLRFEYALNNCIDWTLGNVCPRLFSVFLVEWYVT